VHIGDIGQAEAYLAESVTGDLPEVCGWRVILSDAGRLWASRVEPFTDAQSRAGASRTVDADDTESLRAEIAEQERRAGNTA
jgi:hypothetical protein